MSTLVKIANAHMRIRSQLKKKKKTRKVLYEENGKIEMRKGNKRLKNITRQDTHHET